jgi:hypothetical protein
MSKVIRAKSVHRIWRLAPNRKFEIIDVVGWDMGPERPIPLTPFGRYAEPYVLSTSAGWVAVPSGIFMKSSSDVAAFLEGVPA